MPFRIKKDTQNYLDENDPVKQFIEEKIEITNNKKDFVLSSELYQSFINFNGDDSKGVTTIKFKNIMISKGFTFKKTMYGNGYICIKFKTINNFRNEIDN